MERLIVTLIVLAINTLLTYGAFCAFQNGDLLMASVSVALVLLDERGK